MGWISFDLYCPPGGRSELVLVYCVSWADEVNEFGFIVSAERTRRMSFSFLRLPGRRAEPVSVYFVASVDSFNRLLRIVHSVKWNYALSKEASKPNNEIKPKKNSVPFPIEYNQSDCFTYPSRWEKIKCCSGTYTTSFQTKLSHVNTRSQRVERVGDDQAIVIFLTFFV